MYIEAANSRKSRKMLSAMIKDHQAKQAAKKEEQERRRKEAILSANELTQNLVDHLNVGVAQAYLNQKRLDAEAKQLHVGATNFAKQTQQWLTLIEHFNSSLKEIGDVENWAKTIENDMNVITTALEIAYKTSREK
ncbi:biogenesis of lysosome-related organelles complex 1 subunit 1 [Toxorhynchites rutilus septentrionalis]|uniref:biogenesis of lysosome-related organelles complex 1 subunit 1 n=1 Tax=Toxorhynchites rutilus septentrionalis TaxID=329112 RepID=UPI00247B236B|nr:biogenesis of lysosome-related organelles complex 1 subunit 1 [Toxorhynchites rutilus septentrionalis]